MQIIVLRKQKNSVLRIKLNIEEFMCKIQQFFQNNLPNKEYNVN